MGYPSKQTNSTSTSQQTDIPEWQPGKDYQAGEEYTFRTPNTTAIDIDGSSIQANKTNIGAYRVATTSNTSLTNGEMAKIELRGASLAMANDGESVELTESRSSAVDDNNDRLTNNTTNDYTLTVVTGTVDDGLFLYNSNTGTTTLAAGTGVTIYDRFGASITSITISNEGDSLSLVNVAANTFIAYEVSEVDAPVTGFTSRALTNADNGKTIVPTDEAQTITLDTGLIQGFQVFVNNDATVNGTATITDNRGAGATAFAIVSVGVDAYELISGAASSAPARQVLIVEDQKPSGTDGGASTTGAWVTRELNTVIKNTITGASLTSNQVTLPAGDYTVRGYAPCWRSGRSPCALYDITGALFLTAAGSTSGGSTGAEEPTMSIIDDEFTLSVTSVVELQQIFEVAYVRGLGHQTGLISGLVDRYAKLIIEKV